MKKVVTFLIVFLLGICNIGGLELNLASKYAILYNYDLDKVIYEKSADDRVSIASMTKIVSSIVLIENIDDLDKTVVLKKEHFGNLEEIGASLAGFRLGEKVTYRDLLYGILLPSGAEAVHTLAIEVFGSDDVLVEKMNEKAKTLNLTNTHFENPYGFDDKEHYSTVRDLSIFLKYALKNELFNKIYTTRKYLTSDKSITLYSTIIKALNILGKNAPYIKGSKSGHTDDAGRCLSSLAYDEKNDINYLLVTAKGPEDSFTHVSDAINTYEKLFKEYSKHVLYKEDDVVKTVKTKYAKEKEVSLVTKEEISVFYENQDFDENKITYNYRIPKKISYKAKKDDKLGSVTVLYDGEEVKTVDLYLQQDLHISIIKFIFFNIIPTLLIFIIIVLIVKSNKKTIKIKKR